MNVQNQWLYLLRACLSALTKMGTQYRESVSSQFLPPARNEQISEPQNRN
jgi:hypothetical protein